MISSGFNERSPRDRAIGGGRAGGGGKSGGPALCSLRLLLSCSISWMSNVGDMRGRELGVRGDRGVLSPDWEV